MLRIARVAWAVCLLVPGLGLGACAAGGDGLDPGSPVTLSLWHYYSDVMQGAADELVAEFNATTGKDLGVVVNVTSIMDSAEQQAKLEAIARDDPGAPGLPDLTTAYPATALLLHRAGLLADLGGYLTDQDEALYVPQFLDEGRLDGGLYVFPVAKSTEALFVNETLFGRFAAATGASLDDLATFEGLAATAVAYAEWTDAATPDVAGDGKAFFTADSWFHVAEVQTAQLGGEFVGPAALDTGAATFGRVWDFALPPALAGGFAAVDGYASQYARTGDILASLGSTAGVLFYGDTVVYPDNTEEPVTFTVLPYPVFEGARKVALQRGAGFAVKASEPRRERAAVEFLRWFTAPDQNLRFIRSTGYLPVTRDAFELRLSGEIAAADNPRIQNLLAVAAEMYAGYDFITAPEQDNLSALTAAYENGLKAAMRSGRAAVLDGADPATVSAGLRAGFLG